MSATLFDLPVQAVDARTASLLALIDGDPLHASDRATIVEGILECARMNGGVVDPNMLRTWLRNDETGECVVFPAVIGTTIASLRHKGVLEFAGWVVTEESKSGNNGRPARSYRLVRRPS